MRGERGIFIVILALASALLLALCALGIGLGFLTFNRSIHQNVANLAALGALDAFVRTEGTYQGKAQAALARANYLLAANRLKGTAAGLEPVGFGSEYPGGQLILGTYTEFRPISGDGPCAAYPCFQPNSDPGLVEPTTQANALELRTTSVEGGSMIIPFSQLLGPHAISSSARSLAVMVPRCTALLLDVSPSVFEETHKLNPLIPMIPEAQPGYIPPKPSFTPPLTTFLPFMRAGSIEATPCGEESQTLEHALWCNMGAPFHGLQKRDPGAEIDPLVHYQSDYRTHPIDPSYGFGDEVLFDALYDESAGYIGPQPYASLMLGFNAASRLLAEQSSTADMGLMIVFTGELRDRVPEMGMTPNFGLLAQLTNIRNFGLLDKAGNPVSQRILPNGLLRGWVPFLGTGNTQSGTNIPLAIDLALRELGAHCPAIARKSIVLASDGINTCSLSGCDISLGQSRWNRWQEAENWLLDRGVDGALGRLKREQISFSMILAGASVAPHFMNRVDTTCQGCDPTSASGDPRAFVTIEEAAARGFTVFSSEDGRNFYDHGSYEYKVDEFGEWDPATSSRSPLSDQQAFELLGTPGIVFGRPHGVFGQLALETGGLLCPLLPIHPDGVAAYWDHDGDNGDVGCSGCPEGTPDCSACVLRNSLRAINGAQRYSIFYETGAASAARCLIQAIVQDPYALRDPRIASEGE